MRRYVISSFGILMLLVVGFFPLLGFAGSWVPSNPLVPACNTGIRNGTLENPCGWEQLIVLANNILKFFLYISVPIAAIAFAYAGWLYLSARGDHSQISKAHEIFLNVAIGLVFVLTAWLIVDLILKGLANPSSYISVLGQP